MRATIAGHTFYLAALLCAGLSAQSQVAETPSVDSFASEPYLIKSASHVVSMKADGTGSDLETFEVAIHSQSVLATFSVLSLSYAGQSQRAEFVYARVVHTDGSVDETPVSGAIDQPAPVTQQAPFYSDIKIKQLPVKSLRPGDTLEWQGRIETVHPEVPNQFWGEHSFVQGVVSLNDTAELHVPAGLHLTVWTNPALKSRPEEFDAAGEHVYRWRHSDLRRTVGPEAEAAKLAEEKRLRTPEEELDETKGVLPSLAWTTFPDWASVGAWYRSLNADRMTPDDAIRAKVAELTAGKTTDLDKAQAVYAYVSTGIRYIGVAFGIGRYQPHTAAEVFANQYGDCKDKHILLASMLSVLNLRADPVLVGAGVRFNGAVPAPSAFNHMITHLTVGGKDVWLDATAEVGRWGALLNVIRDQDALLVPLSSPATIVHTPVDLPYPQTSELAVTGSLDDGLTSDSKIALTLHDDNELYLRAALHSISPASYGVFVQNMMANMGFGGTTSEPEVLQLDDPTQPLVISFRYHRVPEKDWGENRITAIFQPIGLPGFTTDKPPVASIRLGAPRTETSRIEMKLPEGWSVNIPEEVHEKAAFATCDVTYKVIDGKLFAERKLVILQKQVPVPDYPKYQSWYDASSVSGVPYIQLLPKPKEVKEAVADTSAALPAMAWLTEAASGSNPEAARLVSLGFEAARGMDLDTARKRFDEARAISATERGLWSGYAGIAVRLGKTAEAAVNVQQEIKYHPDEVEAYPALAKLQRQLGDQKAALETVRAWMNEAPNRVEPALLLSSSLEKMQQHAEALEVAQSAIARLGGSSEDLSSLRLVLADAQVGLGRSSEAAESLAPLLATLTDPARINYAAYLLAEAGTHLPEAEAAEAKVVGQLEADSSEWSLADGAGATAAKQGMMAANWDTMGWILYREGRYADAVGYLAAAVHTSSSSVERDHLNQALAAMHRRVSHDSDLGLRTFPLGPSTGRHGVASFTLLLAAGKVIDSKEAAKQPGSAPALAGAEKLLRAANLNALFPPASKAHLVRDGFVNCGGSQCELILSPL